MRTTVSLLLIGLCSAAAAAQAPETFPVSIKIDTANNKGDLKPIWRFFGCDEPNYAYMKDGKKLLAELGELRPKQVYFRTHNLLTSGDGTPGFKWGSTGIYREDASGKPIYDWTIVDRIFDTYLERGVRPYVQIGFMPKDLSKTPEPYEHNWKPGDPYNKIYTGWAYPPKDYDKWGELVHQWAKHCLEKYGKEEVETWYWETWNEPNIGYWKGTRQEFYKLHDYAVDAVRRAIPNAKVGGPDQAGGGANFLRPFLEHCLRGTNHATGKVGTPLDFIAFHAKGAPRFVDGHVRMGIVNQLRDIDSGFATVASFPELKNTPIVIGESDPEGCAACPSPQNGYRNGTMYSSYTAASFARKHELAEKHGVNFEGALTWAFEFEGQPYFAGFRVLASNGIDHPVLNVFRMMSKMGGKRLIVDSDTAIPLASILREGVRAKPDVSAMASIEGNKLCILTWHYHDDDVPGPAAEIDVSISGLPNGKPHARLIQYTIDENHSNAFATWKRMGSPQQPTPEQYAQLEKSAQLATAGDPRSIPVDGAKLSTRVTLPRQAVSLLVFDLQ